MKRFAQCICILLVVATIMTIPVFAAENAETRASNFFLSSSVYLYEISGTTFQAWFDVDAFKIMDELGASEIKIQRSSDDKNWSTVATYTKEDYSNLICKTTGTHASYVTYTGTAGYYYRAYICLYAKKGSDTGEWNRYTTSIKL